MVLNSNDKHLPDAITQESCLPEIDADACVYAIFNQANCKACVDACPRQAWVLDDNALGLDTDACDGCGLCVPACPSGALHIHFPWIIRKLGKQQIALLACEYSDINEDTGTLPCIHALGLRQLLLLYNAGIKHLLVETAECGKCCRNLQPDIHPDIHHRLAQLNSLLRERNKPAMKIFQRSSKLWKTIFNSDDVSNQGPQVPRRNFLRGAIQLQQIQQLLSVTTPLNDPKYLTIPAGQLLPIVENTEFHWPYSPQLNENRCNGCDACIKLCPTDALQLIQDENTSTTGYKLDPASCTGCGICTTVCELQAISVNSQSLSTARIISLSEKQCTACGNNFHVPQNSTQSKISLCRICQQHNHNRNLFQVLS